MREFATVTDAQFQATVLEAPEPTLVVFWAPWCTQCSAIAPVLSRIASKGSPRLVSVNIEECPQTVARFRVFSVPMMILFRDGHQVKKLIGVQSQGDIETKLHSALQRPNASCQAKDLRFE